MFKNTRYFLTVVLALVFITGCATQHATERIAAFSEANKLTMQNIAAAFDTVERKHYEMQVSRIVNDPESFQCDPSKRTIGHFLSPDELQARMQVLEGIQKYAEKLAVIMGNEQLDEFDERTRDFGKNLTKVNEDLVKKNILNKATFKEGDIKVFTTAVNAIGRWFIEYKRQKGVKESVKNMQPFVDKICTLLAEDIGSSPADSGGRSKGLRDQLWRDYDGIIDRQCNFIEHGKGKLDPIQMRSEIKVMIALEVEQRQADATLKAIQQSLDTLRKTHNKIEECFDKNTVEIDSLISDLITEGKRIKEFYNTLD
ncbi:MAG: hypothetical protein HW406_370 [Candidatus Brocadiaceae bacterium]|nr:hypothetical protein [Candidatus Brocadiaceae bacterium]